MFLWRKRKNYSFKIFADYHQFYIQDEKAKGDLSDCWNDEATANLVAIAPGTVGIGTARNTTVPVKVVLQENAPDDILDEWDHVVDCSIDVPTGVIVIAGCTDYFPDAARINVKPGHYNAQIRYGGLNTLSADGFEGNDRYQIILWRGSLSGVVVRKKWLPG